MTEKISVSVTREHANLLMRFTPLIEGALEWKNRRLLGQIWDEGIDSGLAEPGLSMSDIKAEAARRRKVVA